VGKKRDFQTQLPTTEEIPARRLIECGPQSCTKTIQKPWKTMINHGDEKGLGHFSDPAETSADVLKDAERC